MFDLKEISNAVKINLGEIQTIDFENLTSPNGNIVPNQFSVFIGGKDGNLKAFKSYNSLVAVKVNGILFFDRGTWDYSPTTLKYLKQWLGRNTPIKELRQEIEEGKITLVDLN